MKLSRVAKGLINEDPFTLALPKLSEETIKVIDKVAYEQGGYESLNFIVIIGKLLNGQPNALDRYFSFDDIQALRSLTLHCGGRCTFKFMLELYAWCGHDKNAFYTTLMNKVKQQ